MKCRKEKGKKGTQRGDYKKRKKGGGSCKTAGVFTVQKA